MSDSEEKCWHCHQGVKLSLDGKISRHEIPRAEWQRPTTPTLVCPAEGSYPKMQGSLQEEAQ